LHLVFLILSLHIRPGIQVMSLLGLDVKAQDGYDPCRAVFQNPVVLSPVWMVLVCVNGTNVHETVVFGLGMRQDHE
jgi:hypothetical protein